LLLFYVTGCINSNSGIDTFLFIGVALGFFGDFFLLSKKQRYFILGLISFLLGHIFYILYTLLNFRIQINPVWFGVVTVAYLLVFYCFWRFFEKFLKEMKLPVLFYLGVILLMSFISTLRFATFPSSLSALVFFIGSLCFVFSDTVLAKQMFIKKRPYDEWWVMGSYILAQFLIVYSHLRIPTGA
jgi:uncharacterized membrane protein YhhN